MHNKAHCFVKCRGTAVVAAVVAGALFLLPVGTRGASPTLEVLHADYHEGRMGRGGTVMEYTGKVHFRYDDADIWSEVARWQRRDGIARFSGNVRVVRPTQTLTCKNMAYNRDGKKVVVTGDVDFLDHERSLRITGQRGHYLFDKEDIVVDLNPRLERYDTTGGDTLVIVSERMSYSDSLNMATATNNVVMTRGAMRATSALAYFHPESDMARLRKDPQIYYESHHLTGDSVDLTFVEELLRGISVMRNAKGTYREYGEEDTVITTISGDSLYMSLATDGALDSIWVYRDSRSTYYVQSEAEKMNRAEGKNMVLAFTSEGEARHLKIEGNAKSVYFVEEEDESKSGRNEASGDVMHVTFKDGQAAYLKLVRGVRGVYIASKNP